MKPFTSKSTPWVECGPGALETLPAHLEALSARRVFLVVDRAVAAQTEARLRDLVGPRLASMVVYDLPGEPTTTFVDGIASQARALDADAVVGIGGGSAMDTAKAVAVLRTNPGLAADYQGPPGRVKTRGVPLVLVPTTAGSGSEATWSAVLINEHAGVKRGINGRECFASVAILDPSLTLTLPPRQTAISGMDALIHAVESFGTKNATSFSRMYAREAMTLLFSALPRAVNQGADEDARSSMLLGSFLAGVAIINSEVGLSHVLSYPLGARYRIPHGLGNAILFPATSAFNAHVCPEVYDKVARIGGLLGGAKDIESSLSGFVRSLGLTDRLGDFRVEKGDLSDLAERAMLLEGPLRQHRRPVTVPDAIALYEVAL